MAGFQHHIAVIETPKGKVRLPVRSSSQEAFKDGLLFGDGSRPFRVVPLLNAQAQVLIAQDRQAALRAAQASR